MSFSDSQNRDLSAYLKLLREISALTGKEIVAKIEESENVGAIPSTEIDSLDGFSIDFETSWDNHEEARNWADKILKNRTTFAADGSQYYSEKETSLPVGAVQIGSFENPHNAAQSYEKYAELEILTPKELIQSKEEPLKPESKVGEAMFIGEV